MWTSTTHIEVYPGLLSQYWRKWHVKPQTIIYCNINETIKINDNFYFYATVVLNKAIVDRIHFLSISFHYAKIRPLKILPSDQEQFSQSLPQVGCFQSKYVATLTFMSLQYSGPHSTFTALQYSGQHSTFSEPFVQYFANPLTIKSCWCIYINVREKWDMRLTFTYFFEIWELIFLLFEIFISGSWVR